MKASTRPVSISTCSTESGSTSTGLPVSVLAFSTSARPSSPIPWKASGRVRGLKMLARSIEAPASRMASAWLTYPGSTAQGPAMTGTAGPPKTTSPMVTRRRAAKMVVLDLDHPDIEEFIGWKVSEEQKVADLVTGSIVSEKHLNAIMKAANNEAL